MRYDLGRVCMVPWHILKTFLGWLHGLGVEVICCSYQCQSLPIAGIIVHSWLQEKEDYYDEVEVDYWAKGDKLKALKKSIHLQSDKVQCHEVWKALPNCLGWDQFVKSWKPSDIILTN